MAWCKICFHIHYFFVFLEPLLWWESQSVRWTQEQRLGVGVINFIYKHEQLLGTVNIKHKLRVSEARGCEWPWARRGNSASRSGSQRHCLQVERQGMDKCGQWGLREYGDGVIQEFQMVRQAGEAREHIVNGSRLRLNEEDPFTICSRALPACLPASPYRWAWLL